mgnify:FL=1
MTAPAVATKFHVVLLSAVRHKKALNRWMAKGLQVAGRRAAEKSGAVTFQPKTRLPPWLLRGCGRVHQQLFVHVYMQDSFTKPLPFESAFSVVQA